MRTGHNGIILAGVLTAACLRGDISPDHPIPARRFKLSYQLRIGTIPPEAKSLEVWTPFPQSEVFQSINGYEIRSELPHTVYVDSVNGNKILAFYAEEQVPEAANVELNFDITRLEIDSHVMSATAGEPSPAEELERYLAADEFVPIDGLIAQEAREVAGADMTAQEKAEALYRHLFLTTRYDKSGTGWGNGDALFCCCTRRGNCTDIHSLFIGMARSLGVPARFIIGFPLSPSEGAAGEIAGYHCWAEFYLDDKGWIPVDISEAIKRPERREYFFGRIDQHRVSFSTGRDIKIRARSETLTLNYFIDPVVLVDGVPFGDFDYHVSYSDIQ